MIKRSKIIIFSLLTSCILCSCGNTKEQTYDEESISLAEESYETKITDSGAGEDPAEPEVTDSESVETDAPGVSGSESNNPISGMDGRAIYKQMLSQIMDALSAGEDFTLPDGTVLYGQGRFGNDWYHLFCIADIDSDGREELLFIYDPAVMAYMVSIVFDTDGDEIRVQSTFWLDAEYYTNGVVRDLASHNHSYGDTIWPYTILLYDSSSDTYYVAGSAASMEKTTEEWERKYYVGGEYISFPEELDIDGDGVLYLISEPAPDSETESAAELPLYDDGTWSERIVDRNEYDAWIGGYLQGAEQIELDWKEFTPENVEDIGK